MFGNSLAVADVLGVFTGDAYTVADWFGDGLDAVLIHSPEARRWRFVQPSTGRVDTFVFGQVGGTPTWGKFDGSRPQVASFLDGVWWIKDHDATTHTVDFYGVAGDVPVPGDYETTGADQLAVFRDGQWFYGASSESWGIGTDIPVPGRYFNAATDIPAVWRPGNGTWFLLGGSGPTIGNTTDTPIPAQWNDDGLTIPAIYRPINGRWFINSAALAFTFGGPGASPLAGDFFGDGCDAAVWIDGAAVMFRNGVTLPIASR